MKPRTLKYFFKEALKSMKRNGLMTLASISTVALSLFMLGVFLCGVINLNNMASSLENQVQLSIYLKDGLTTDQIMAVGKQIKAIPNLKHLEFVNKEQAMKEFKARLGDQQQLVNALGDVNPLPNSYVLTFDNPSDVKATAKLATTFQGVESTHYGQDIIEELFRVTQIIRIGGIVLIGFLAAATLFIISNTIRLTVFARRKEIAIMKYVGATNWFIRWPFVIEGIVIGAIGALLSSIVLYFAYNAVFKWIVSSMFIVNLVQPQFVLTTLLACFVGGGILIGAIGSIFALRKFLIV